MPINVVFRQGTRAITNSLTSHRLFLYGVASTLAVCAAVGNALRNYTNFYSVAIYLSKSSRSVLIFANFAVILALLAGHCVQMLFFGALRANEVERLYDRLWIFVTESLLAFTIFRDEFDAPFAIMFGSLLFIKSFHWLASDRIEWMDQRPYPGPSLLFHVRMSTLFLILWTADLLMLLFAVENTLTYGVGGMVLFACEYGILLATAANTIAKYLLSVYDLRRASTRGGENAPPWEQKSIWTFYFELVTDFSKLTTYLCFFTIILTFYGLPLNIVRDIYFTARSFVTRLKALRRYQTATKNMDERYPNATPEEMAASDHTCIICREEMVLPVVGAQPTETTEGPNMTPKKLPCGHIFHFHCLRSWLERQQSCPTCRRTVLETAPPAPRPAQQPQPQPNAAAPPPAAAQANVPGPQNRNVAPANPNNNNPGGMDLLRRLIATGPQNQNRAGNNPPVNVIIQYDVHNYGGNQQPPALPPVVERRPPQFAGFHGPGGVWQPWAVDGFAPHIPAAGEAPTPTPTIQPTGARSTDIPLPTPTTTQPQEVSSSQAVPESSSEAAAPVPGPETSSNAPINPRDAAAVAALRRFNSHITTPSTPSEETPPFAALSSSQDASVSSSRATPEPATEDGPATGPSLISDPATVPQEGSSTVNASVTSTSGTPAPAPALGVAAGSIPDENEWTTWYSPAPSDSRTTGAVPQEGSSTANASVPSTSGTSAPASTPGSVQLPALIPLDLNPNLSTNARRTTSYSPRPQWRMSTRRNAPPMTPLAQLPPTVTPEQLATMDRLTREAIDERLRILEGVSGAVYRCIDELMRVRSALPPVTNPPPPGPPVVATTPTATVPGQSQTPVDPAAQPPVPPVEAEEPAT